MFNLLEGWLILSFDSDQANHLRSTLEVAVASHRSHPLDTDANHSARDTHPDYRTGVAVIR